MTNTFRAEKGQPWAEGRGMWDWADVISRLIHTTDFYISFAGHGSLRLRAQKRPEWKLRSSQAVVTTHFATKTRLSTRGKSYTLPVLLHIVDSLLTKPRRGSPVPEVFVVIE
ncbi:hypothetical protein E2C01_058649 [Portunus trituberculatus]|uniref:Uncharacterized protein n=1 Tax=Portunus trituberculatus TaxID=210409 RepID=A0A5B7GW46_PORTR|nr:hypothetical protein [Portunus trituberculatus]